MVALLLGSDTGRYVNKRANFRQSITAADGAAANGNFPSASGVQVDGGEYNVFIDGSFQGATLTLQLGMDSSAFVSLTEGVFTAANADFRLTAPRNAYVRGVVSDAGSPTPDINVTLVPIPVEGFWGK
jgi:hypothetical protein